MNKNLETRLMEDAQKIFIEELKNKIDEIETLIDNRKDGVNEDDTDILIRFFHSVNGTASTLGLYQLSSTGREWESRLMNINEQGQKIDSVVLKDLYIAVKDIKKKISLEDAQNCISKTLDKNNEYVNMPDRGKILIVDDDIAILKLLENALTLEGYKVYICDDSASAIDTIAVVKPDIIILDIMMPKLNGYELLGKIKSNPQYSDISAIFLSAKRDVEDRIKGIKSGADDYITKPFVIGEVITRIEMIMRRSANYKEKLLKDCLTGAYSRYYFNLRIAEELERYRRYGTIFSIAFIDMDHFEYINDQYRHQAGDCLLKELVFYIVRNSRKCDSIYRYGGEKFVLILPNTTDIEAYEVVERLREGFSDKPISVGGATLHATFSAGIKQVKHKNENVEHLISVADKAVYCAKRCGRNRVIVYDKEMEAQSLKKTLLIVDDENTILKLLKDRFTNTGYNVVTAKDGKSAIALAEQINPDAILLDMSLPDIDGSEVCKKLKLNTATHFSKIIMLSKVKQKESTLLELKLGADDYITKPFSMEELEARVLKALNNIS